jgi:hypothetical protein
MISLGRGGGGGGLQPVEQGGLTRKIHPSSLRGEGISADFIKGAVRRNLKGVASGSYQ